MSRLTVEHGACSCRRVSELYYHEATDEYLCEQCLDNANEAAYNRQQERDLESPPESTHEEQLRLWEAHKR
jgi:hypothetical protein